MTLFLRLLNERDKASALQSAISATWEGKTDTRVFQVEPEDFRKVLGAPFAYWVSEKVREIFKRLPAFESAGRTVRSGIR